RLRDADVSILGCPLLATKPASCRLLFALAIPAVRHAIVIPAVRHAIVIPAVRHANDEPGSTETRCCASTVFSVPPVVGGTDEGDTRRAIARLGGSRIIAATAASGMTITRTAGMTITR